MIQLGDAATPVIPSGGGCVNLIAGTLLRRSCGQAHPSEPHTDYKCNTKHASLKSAFVIALGTLHGLLGPGPAHVLLD